MQFNVKLSTKMFNLIFHFENFYRSFFKIYFFKLLILTCEVSCMNIFLVFNNIQIKFKCHISPTPITYPLILSLPKEKREKSGKKFIYCQGQLNLFQPVFTSLKKFCKSFCTLIFKPRAEKLSTLFYISPFLSYHF